MQYIFSYHNSSVVSFTAGLTLEQVKKAGGLSGISAMPRELNYPVMKGDRWHDLYDLIRSVFTHLTQTKFIQIPFIAPDKSLFFSLKALSDIFLISPLNHMLWYSLEVAQ